MMNARYCYVLISTQIRPGGGADENLVFSFLGAWGWTELCSKRKPSSPVSTV